MSSQASTSSGAGRGRRIRGLDAEQRREQRRTALLDAALELFASQGYVNTSIEQLCQHAYVGTKAFYETFASREELYSALLARIVDDSMARVTALLDPTHSEDEQARVLLAEFVHAMVDDVRIAKVTFGEGSAITPAAERQRRGNRRMIAAFIEKDVWAPYDDPARADGHGVAIGLVGGMLDLIADWMIEGDTSPEAQAVLRERVLDFYLTVRRGMRLG